MSEITVRLGKSNVIKERNERRTPLYLQLGEKYYTGIIEDRDSNVYSISWSDNVPQFVRDKWCEFIDLYKHFRNAIPA